MTNEERVSLDVRRETAAWRGISAFLAGVGIILLFAEAMPGGTIAVLLVIVVGSIGQKFEHAKRLTRAREEDARDEERRQQAELAAKERRGRLAAIIGDTSTNGPT